MARRHRTSLTQRERECRRAARDKAARMLMQQLWRRVRVVLVAFAVCASLSLLVFEGWTGGISRAMNRTVHGFWRITADSGFAVHTMYLEGRSRTPLSDVKEALAVQKGDAILELSLDEIRERLESLPTIKHVSVERALPDRLYIKLVERDPVAIWQHEGKLSLIDDEGAAMDDLRLRDYRGLPLVIGVGAPKHVKEVLALMDAHPELARRVTDIVWVSDRRWNIHLSGEVEIKLPEENASAAWDHFARLESEHKLLEQQVRMVDLRAADRIYIRMSPQGREA